MPEDAEWELEELRALGYEPSIAGIRRSTNIQDPVYLERYLDGLRKAGLLE